MFCVCNSYIVKKFCMKNVTLPTYGERKKKKKKKVNLYSNGEKKGKEKIGIVYFFFVFIINASSFFLSQGNVGEYYTFHYYTHIRVFCCVFCLQGFLCPGKILFVLFVIFFASNFNMFNLFWYLYSCSERPVFSFVFLHKV
jgi:hypothetical protein